MKRLSILTAVCILFVSTARADEAIIALWNGEELFDVTRVQERSGELLRFAEVVKPDVLLLDEVCSLAVAEKVREVMQLDVAGSHVQGFADAVKTGETFGSDHFAVFVVYEIPEP